MAASRRLFLFVLLGACSIPPESDYVSDGSADASTTDAVPTLDAALDVAFPDAAPQSPCADASYTLGGHCYVFYATHAAWHEAESQCALANGTLVAINDVVEQNYVANIVNPNVPDSGANASNGVWIGGYRDGGTDAYAWTTGEPFTFTNWGTGSPKGNPNVFMYTSAVQNRWDDFKEAVQAPFICEY